MLSVVTCRHKIKIANYYFGSEKTDIEYACHLSVFFFFFFFFQYSYFQKVRGLHLESNSLCRKYLWKIATRYFQVQLVSGHRKCEKMSLKQLTHFT